MIGDNILRIRKENKKSRKWLSEITGISEMSIRRYESNERTPSAEQALAIAEAFGLGINDIVRPDPDAIDLSGDWDIAPGQLSEEMKEFIRSGTLADYMASNYIKLNENGKILANTLVESLTNIDDTLKGMKLKEK